MCVANVQPHFRTAPFLQVRRCGKCFRRTYTAPIFQVRKFGKNPKKTHRRTPIYIDISGAAAQTSGKSPSRASPKRSRLLKAADTLLLVGAYPHYAAAPHPAPLRVAGASSAVQHQFT